MTGKILKHADDFKLEENEHVSISFQGSNNTVPLKLEMHWETKDGKKKINVQQTKVKADGSSEITSKTCHNIKECQSFLRNARKTVSRYLGKAPMVTIESESMSYSQCSTSEEYEQDRTEELPGPIVDKINELVKDVAEEQSYGQGKAFEEEEMFEEEEEMVSSPYGSSSSSDDDNDYRQDSSSAVEIGSLDIEEEEGEEMGERNFDDDVDYMMYHSNYSQSYL